jgi:hypothetical protein
MYVDPYEAYKICVKGARNAYEVAKERTLSFYASSPPKEKAVFKEGDLKFMETFNTAIKKLEEHLRKRDTMELNSDLFHFFTVLGNLTVDIETLHMTKFSFEYLEASKEFLGNERLKELHLIVKEDAEKKAAKAKKRKKAKKK